MKYKSLLMISILLTSILLGACSQQEAGHQDGGHVMGDKRVTTSGASVLPDFLDGKHEDIQTLYIGAAQHKDLLEHMPCYCGCGDSVGHMNNYDCFIHDEDQDSITWDDHGTKCNVCLEIAAKAMIEYSEGKTVKEIRHIIDEQYKEGYAPPTPTPPVFS